MKNPAVLNWLVGFANFLLMAGIVAMFKLFRMVNNLRIYVRQICSKLEIDCGKDLG